MSRVRRNLLALAVCLVSLVGLGASLVAVPVLNDLDSEDTVVVVEPGEPAQLKDWTFTLTDSAEFPGKGLDVNRVPVGNALVAAIIMIEPGPGVGPDDSRGCDATLVQTGTDRSWDPLVTEWEFGYELAEDSTTHCYMDEETKQLEVVFLAPEGVYDVAAIDITMNIDFTDVFRFELVR